MAILGISTGAGTDWLPRFLDEGVAALEKSEREEDKETLRRVRVGDLIFAKSYTPETGLVLRAAGVVVNDEVRAVEGLGPGVVVKWKWTGEKAVGRIDDGHAARADPLHEEHHYDVQLKVIELLFVGA